MGDEIVEEHHDREGESFTPNPPADSYPPEYTSVASDAEMQENPTPPVNEWSVWVENEMENFRAQLVGMHTNVENNTHLVNQFSAQVGARVPGALEDFNAAVAQEFVSTNDLVERTRERLVQEMQNATSGLQDQMRTEMQSLFSEQSMKDGFLWQNLVSVCNANLCTIVNAHVEELKKAVAVHVEHEISLACAGQENRLVDWLNDV